MLFIIFSFVFGIFFGSFLKVLADRLPRGESPVSGRSYCEYCKHQLSGFDLIPVLSFLVLRGRCKYCKKHLSWSYPLSETMTGLIFVTPVIFLNNSLVILNSEYFLKIIFYFFVLSGMIVIFFSDLKYYIIPFQVLLPSLFIVILWQAFFYPQNMFSILLSGVIAFALFLTIFIATKGRGMGFGDVVYSFYMGVLLGFPGIIVGLYVAFLTGAIVSVILILLRKKKLKGGVIPFGPFLIFGTYIALFLGDSLGKFIMSYLYL